MSTALCYWCRRAKAARLTAPNGTIHHDPVFCSLLCAFYAAHEIIIDRGIRWCPTCRAWRSMDGHNRHQCAAAHASERSEAKEGGKDDT